MQNEKTSSLPLPSAPPQAPFLNKIAQKLLKMREANQNGKTTSTAGREGSRLAQMDFRECLNLSSTRPGRPLASPPPGATLFPPQPWYAAEKSLPLRLAPDPGRPADQSSPAVAARVFQHFLQEEQSDSPFRACFHGTTETEIPGSHSP